MKKRRVQYKELRVKIYIVGFMGSAVKPILS